MKWFGLLTASILAFQGIEIVDDQPESEIYVKLEEFLHSLHKDKKTRPVKVRIFANTMSLLPHDHRPWRVTRIAREVQELAEKYGYDVRVQKEMRVNRGGESIVVYKSLARVKGQ